MKKEPIHRYEKENGTHGITGQMAEESQLRTQKWLQHGCNAFDASNPTSNPLSFWLENDILEYIWKYKIPICPIYGEVVPVDEQLSIGDTGETPTKFTTTGCKRSGCSLCGFGLPFEKSPNRLELLKQTHPGVYGLLDKCKNNGVTFREAIEWTNEHGNLKIRL